MLLNIELSNLICGTILNFIAEKGNAVSCFSATEKKTIHVIYS